MPLWRGHIVSGRAAAASMRVAWLGCVGLPPGPRRKGAGHARPEGTPPAMQIYIPTSTHPGFTSTSPTTRVRVLAPEGPTLRSIFRGDHQALALSARNPKNAPAPPPLACRTTDSAPRPPSTPGANWHEDPAPTTPGAPPSTGTNASPPGRLAGHGVYMCMGCPRAAPPSARPVNWHQRPRPHSPTPNAGPRAPLERAAAASRPSARPAPTGTTALVRILSPAPACQLAPAPSPGRLLPFLPREPPRPAVTEGPPSPANWHRALRTRQPSRRPPQVHAAGQLAPSLGRARPGQARSPAARITQVPHVCQLARRSSRSSLPGVAPGAARFAPSSPPALPRSLMGVSITNRAKVGLTLSDS